MHPQKIPAGDGFVDAADKPPIDLGAKNFMLLQLFKCTGGPAVVDRNFNAEFSQALFSLFVIIQSGPLFAFCHK
jgi:hypothetical protein